MWRKYAIAAAIWCVVILYFVLGSGKHEKNADLLLVGLAWAWTLGWAAWVVILWVRHRHEPEVRERLISWDAVMPRWLSRFLLDEPKDERKRGITFRSP